KRLNHVNSEIESVGGVLLQTDKSGKFAVLSKDEFSCRVNEAMKALFKPCSTDLKRVKKEIVNRLQACDLNKLARQITSVRQDTCTKKFLVKDHKVNYPLRVVLNEIGSWQNVISSFLQKCLAHVRIETSLSIKNSEELLEQIGKFHGTKRYIGSLDIKDLYYSINKTILFNRFRNMLELDLVGFQSRAGIAIEDFLFLLQKYLTCNVLKQEETLMTQKDGICIGSKIAPILSEVYLNVLDCVGAAIMEQKGKDNVYTTRYVDDILICTKDE
ncbi:unnamed protein product, partial [Ixodes persulcatus]